jgi:hypothetical protein
LAIADSQVSTLVASDNNNNPCSLYFLNILLDCTFGESLRVFADSGVAIFFFTLKFLTWVLTERLGRQGYISGQYGTPPSSVKQVTDPGLR